MSNEKQTSTTEPGKQGQKIVPFLWFDGKVEEALNFYTSIFKNSKVTNVNRMGGEVFSATFQLDGLQFYALNGGPQFQFTPAVSFFINCYTQNEVDEFWEKLSEGGRKDRCGWLQDKYGLSWQVVPTILGKLLSNPDPLKSKRVMNAMMQMDKLDIKGLTDSYEGK
jgi:predicted 3-demethylubiquinone-9 3-methyltransferase (glyoxalase superfamily)